MEKSHLEPTPWVTTMDDSDVDWGTLCLSEIAQGRWNFPAHGIVLNILELRAAFQALQVFCHLTSGSLVMLILDNMTAVAYMRKQRNQQSVSIVRSQADYDLGSGKPVQLVSDLCSRSPECSGSFPLLSAAGQQRVDSPQGGLLVGTDPGHLSGGRPLCITVQQQTSKVLFEAPSPPRLRGGHPDRALEVFQGLCLSSHSGYSPVPAETQNRRGRDCGDNPILAQQAVVCAVGATQFLGSNSPAFQTRPTV